MKTKLTNIQTETLDRLVEIIYEIHINKKNAEMCLNKLNYDKTTLIDICLKGEACLGFYFDAIEISLNLVKKTSELKSYINTKFHENKDKEDFVIDILYNHLDNFLNVVKLNTISPKFKDNKTGKYAALIINVLKEAQFIDKNLNHVYVNHNILEMIMLTGENCFYDEFGVNKNDLHKKFILACNNFHDQFKEDYPNLLKYNDKYKLKYYDKLGIGVRNFIRRIISQIVFCLKIEKKNKPIFIDITKSRANNNEVSVRICLGKRTFGKYLYGDLYILNKRLKKADIKRITSQVEGIINSVDSEFDLDFVLNVVEEKLGVAA
jgi:hypothetical protein